MFHTFYIFEYTQLVSEHTHCMPGCTERLIDLCYVGSRVPVIDSGLCSSIEKHHSCVWVKIQASVPKPKRRKSRKVYLWKDADWAQIRRFISEAGLLDGVINALSVDLAWRSYCLKCWKQLKLLCPLNS